MVGWAGNALASNKDCSTSYAGVIHKRKHAGYVESSELNYTSSPCTIRVNWFFFYRIQTFVPNEPFDKYCMCFQLLIIYNWPCVPTKCWIQGRPETLKNTANFKPSSLQSDELKFHRSIWVSWRNVCESFKSHSNTVHIQKREISQTWRQFLLQRSP